MRTLGLLMFALIFPLIWGWGMYVLFSRCWPAGDVQDRPKPATGPPPLDFQI